MKRTAPVLALALIAALALTLAACSGTPTGSATGTPSAAPTSAAQGYVFVAKGATIAMNAPAAPILTQLGAWTSYSEAASCAYQGLDKTYTYPSFQLVTYTQDDVEYVESLLILDDTVATPEGIFLGASLADVKAAYGSDFAQNLGLYTYTKGAMSLQFLFENDQLTQIEYVAKIG